MEENMMTLAAHVYQKINDLLPPNGGVYCWGLNLNRNEFVVFLTGIFTSSNVEEVKFLGFGCESSIVYKDNKLIYYGKETKEIEVEEYYFDGVKYNRLAHGGM